MARQKDASRDLQTSGVKNRLELINETLKRRVKASGGLTEER